MDETPQNAEGYFGKDNEWNKGNPPYSFLKARDKSIRLENYIDPIQKIAATVAKTLKSEMLAPNVQLLVEILPLLNHEEVLDLRVRYKKIVKISDGRGVNVAKHIKLRLKDENPNLMKACYACALGKWESEAYWANFLYQNEKSRRELLIEALMGRTNHEIREIKDGFKDKKYNDSLKTCMRVELKEDRLKKAVLLVLEERRMEDDAVLDQVLVKLDVEQLHLAVDRERPDENSMINIILLRSDTHLREVLRLYQREYQANFAREMLKKSENLVGEVLAHVLNGVINRPVRDALLINHALTALRKDEPCSELIISRLLRYHWDPKHMIDIKRAFRERFGKDLREVVRESIEGEWGQFCERLCAMPVGYRILGLEPIA
ncbi:hypothetical protein BGZ60DRAFT_365120 [Tricladium varicosporioides]|nr:hypothetical protein BGZ60DRAFT_365120 [Hymenoscyphus varicosporioides]